MKGLTSIGLEIGEKKEIDVEILFRGKVRGDYSGYESVVKDNGWIFGDLRQVGHYISIDSPKWNLRVIPKTVGQFSGMFDKNKKRIFTGDVLRNEKGDIIICVFEINDGLSLFNLIDKKHPKRMYFHIDEYFEIIGNVHDNPEFTEDNK